MRCYLAGFICGTKLEECSSWRKRIRMHFAQKSWDDLIFFDPMNGQAISTITTDGLKSSVDPQALFHRDYRAIQESDLIIVNLNTFGETRTPTGTICEIALAWEMKKPIIIITDEMQYKAHPFLRYFASAFVKDVDELLENQLIEYFYRGTVNPRYE